MSFDNLMGHASDIASKMWEKGLHELIGSGSSAFAGQELPKLEQDCFDVPALFQPFTETPDPKSFDPLIEDLKQAMARLSMGDDQKDPISTNGRLYYANPILQEIPGSESFIESWSGRAAMEFKSKFIDPFPALVSNQFLLVSALKAALEAEQAMWRKMRDDIDDIAEKTISKLDALGKSCSQNEWSITFTVVSAVAGMVAAVPSLGTSAMLSLTAIGAATSIVGAVPVGDDPPESKIHGGDVFQIFDSMYQCVKDETTYVNHTEDRQGPEQHDRHDRGPPGLLRGRPPGARGRHQEQHHRFG